MNTRTEWMLNNSLFGSGYPNPDLVVEQAKDRYLKQRDFSSEGKEGFIDGIAQRFVVQEHSNSLNQLQRTKKIFSDLDSGMFEGSYIDFDGDKYIVGFEVFDNNAFLQSRILKCTVLLKKYDKYGNLVQIESASQLDTSTTSTTKDSNEMSLIDSDMVLLVQSTEDTVEFDYGDEFIFGKGKKQKYRIVRINNVDAEKLIKLYLMVYEIDPEKDNIELGIANYADRPQFSLSVINDLSQISIGETLQLEYTLLDKDGIKSDFHVVWESSDEAIATVNSEGLVTAISDGIFSITCSMEKNSSVSDFVDLEVTATPIDNFEIHSDNESISIVRTMTEVYNWNLYNNGVSQPSNFTFTIDASSTASYNDYVFTIIDSNSYSIKCVDSSYKNVVVNVLEDGGLSAQVTYKLIGY